MQNVVMNSWCLACALIGTFLMDRTGRKTLCLSACVGMTIMMFILGGLTKSMPFNPPAKLSTSLTYFLSSSLQY